MAVYREPLRRVLSFLGTKEFDALKAQVGDRGMSTKCSLSQMRVWLEREILTTCKARGRKRYGTENR